MSDLAFINVGGSGTSDYPGFVRNVPAAGGFSEFAREIGPKLTGYKRLWVHNSGGLWTQFNQYDDAISPRANRERAASQGYPWKCTRLMWCDQWLRAKLAGLSWADDRELRLFHDTLMADFGMEEIVYYYGGPDHAEYDLQKLCIEPVVQFEGASFGFDHIVEEQEFADCERLFRFINRTNKKARIYTEARPFEDITSRLTKHVDGTVATADFDLTHPVGSLPETQERAKAMGEVIRIVDPDSSGNYPDPIDGVTYAKRGALR